MFKRDGYYYLFVNWGLCCQGVNSTYNVRVGRSTTPSVFRDKSDVLMANGAAMRVNRLLMDGRESRHANLLHQVFDPADFRPVIVNWPAVAEKFLHHLRAQIAAAPTDPVPRRLLDEIARYPDVPAPGALHGDEAPAPVLTLEFRSRTGGLRFFETITTFSMPHDVTLQELRIECAFPADARTAEVCARLAQAENAVA